MTVSERVAAGVASDCILRACPTPDLCNSFSACDAKLLQAERKPRGQAYEQGRDDERRAIIAWLRTEEGARLARVNAAVSHIERAAHLKDKDATHG